MGASDSQNRRAIHDPNYCSISREDNVMRSIGDRIRAQPVGWRTCTARCGGKSISDIRAVFFSKLSERVSRHKHTHTLHHVRGQRRCRRVEWYMEGRLSSLARSPRRGGPRHVMRMSPEPRVP
jgi:hypothetical protein